MEKIIKNHQKINKQIISNAGLLSFPATNSGIFWLNKKDVI